MTRRDTIIVAVLINAGLLIVLFASALKTSQEPEFVAAPSPVIQEIRDFSSRKETISQTGDEVDMALQSFAEKALVMQSQTPPVMKEEPIVAPVSTPLTFVEDLKMVEQPNASPVQPLAVHPTPQIKTGSDFIEVKVKKGDVLEKIARYNHVTVAEIMKVNQLTTTQLRIGQVLKIPNKILKKTEVQTIATSPAAMAEAKYYTVKKGDSPWTIAMNHHLKVEDLLKLNHMTQEQARRLKPGDQLRIQ